MKLIFPLLISLTQSLNEPIFTDNIVYNGPFNQFKQRRRLTTNIDPAGPSSNNVKFYHGVASGDPTANDIVIWTRVTPPYQDNYARDLFDASSEVMKNLYKSIPVKWVISTHMSKLRLFQNNQCHFPYNNKHIKCGITQTSASVDFTVKIIVDGLESDTWYYYQFMVGDTLSPIGRTRTIPSASTNLESWRFAFGSCKQYSHGFFTNLNDIASRLDIDMMVFLGDYIYEFPNSDLVNGSTIGQIPYPDNFLYTLDHYRGRYLQHHLDKNVQAAHKMLPWFIVWDDHEVVNDYWKDGAPARWQDDNLFGVSFMERKGNAYQAFFEWLPVRPVDVDIKGGLYHSQRFGDLFDLMMIDSRTQRTQPADDLQESVDLSFEEHYAFGQTQRTWLLDELSASKDDNIKWRILGSDNVFGQSPTVPDIFEYYLFGEDKLEGYHQERQIILDYINTEDISNVISMAGGPHTGIAQKIFSTGIPIKNDANSYPIFTEFTVDAISAPKLFEADKWAPYVDKYVSDWSWVSPYFRLFADGYCIMDINKERIKVEYWVNYNQTTSSQITSHLDVSLCVYDDIVEFYECGFESDSISSSSSTDRN